MKAPLERSFTSLDGLTLHERRWLVDGDAKGVVFIVHGGGEHSGRYAHVAAALNEHAFHVCTFDLRGHGKSEGRRLFVRDFEDYVKDLDQALSRVREAYRELPLFLLGHSLGGAIATLYTLKKPDLIQGLILSGPFLHVGKGFSPIKIAIAKLLGSIVPHMPVAKLDESLVSSDPAVVADYRNDPLNHHKGIPAGTGVATLKALFTIQEKASMLDKPLLIVHGSQDGLADVEGSRFLHETAASTDNTLEIYHNFYHEVMNEPGKEQVLEDIAAWINQRV